MKFGIFDQFGALNSAPVFEAFALSLLDHGLDVVPHDASADVAVIWSLLWAGRMRKNQQVWQRFKTLRRPVIVIEVGNLLRGQTWRIGINGVNLDSAYQPIGNSSDRADKLGMCLHPWRNDGEHIVIAMQRPDSEQWQGRPRPREWAESIIDDIRKISDRPIILRPHPRHSVRVSRANVVISRPEKLNNTYDDYDFENCLRGAWAVVNWNSTPGVDAVINGIPAFVGNSSRAAPVANHDIREIEHPLRPDRQQWFNDLAHTEWTIDEIRQGVPINLFLPILQKLLN
jgi:hypothetical protein